MKKLISVILVLVMILSMSTMLAACGSDDDGDKDSGKNNSSNQNTPENEDDGEVTIVGTWKANVDLMDMLMEQLGEDDMAKYIDMDKFPMTMILTLNDDGTYESTVDEDALEDTLEEFVAAVAEGSLEYLEDMLEDQGMTLDEYLDATGMTKADFKDEITNSISVEDLLGEMSSKGNYKEKNGKLYFTDSKNEEVDEDTQYYTIKLSATTLTIEDYTGDNNDEDDLVDAIGPIEFKKK